MQIDRLSSAEMVARQPALVALLQDVVNDGAAIGFLAPLGADEAAAFWRGVAVLVQQQRRIVLVARTAAGIVGSVGLDLAQQSNGRHRAEVVKMMVHQRARRQGIGRALLRGIEDAAREEGRSLLVLDTRRDDAGERLYRAHGYTEAGIIPRYARSSDGSLHDTVLFYRWLHDTSDDDDRPR